MDLLKLTPRGVAQAGARALDMPHAACSSLCRMPDYAE
jgi:hypothetical protein